MTAILGGSGSGKSTLLNLLGGLTPPDRVTRVGGAGGSDAQGAEAQEITLRIPRGEGRSPKEVDLAASAGLRALRAPAALAGRISWVFQRSFLLREASGRANVAVASASSGRWLRAADLDDWERALGFDAPRLDGVARTLSGGEEQRVALLRGLFGVGARGLILADEPTASLDRRNSLLVMSALRAWVDAGAGERTVVFVTHDRPLARVFADAYVEFEDLRPRADGGAWARPIAALPSPIDVAEREAQAELEAARPRAVAELPALLASSPRRRLRFFPYLRASAMITRDELLGPAPRRQERPSRAAASDTRQAPLRAARLTTAFRAVLLLLCALGVYYAYRPGAPAPLGIAPQDAGRILLALGGVGLALTWLRARVEALYIAFLVAICVAAMILDAVLERVDADRLASPAYNHVVVRGHATDFPLTPANTEVLERALSDLGYTPCLDGGLTAPVCVYGRWERRLRPVALYDAETDACGRPVADVAASVLGASFDEPSFRRMATAAGVGARLGPDDVFVSEAFLRRLESATDRQISAGERLCVEIGRMLRPVTIVVAAPLFDTDEFRPEIVVRASTLRAGDEQLARNRRTPFNHAAIYLDVSHASALLRFIETSRTRDRRAFADAFGLEAESVRLYPQSSLERIIEALEASRATERLLNVGLLVLLAIVGLAMSVFAAGYLSRNEAALCVLRAFQWPTPAIFLHVWLRYLIVVAVAGAIAAAAVWAVAPMVAGGLGRAFGLPETYFELSRRRVELIAIGVVAVTSFGVFAAFANWRIRAARVADRLKEVA